MAGKKTDYRTRFRRRKIIRVAFVCSVFLFVTGGFLLFSGNKKGSVSDTKELVRFWKDGSYREAFDLSEKELEKKPMDFFLLMVHGFSSYQIALAQINTFDMLSYIERAIWALRKAQLTRQGENDPRIKYVLGQAYFYKGPAFADLCIKYLQEALLASYQAEDIPQFLGLAYASIHDYRSSIEAFSQALKAGEEAGGVSDILLLAIARSYLELKEPETAKPYIIRAVEISRDFVTISTARLMLAGILTGSGDFSGAEAQITAVISEGGNSAEAHFELGELYNAMDNPARDYYKARAEWRRAAVLDPNFAPARARLNI
jgi:tetratricopeptide (TPR) repeat protein